MRVPGSGFRASGSGFRVSDFGCRLPATGFRVPASRFRVPDFGFQNRIKSLSNLGCGVPGTVAREGVVVKRVEPLHLIRGLGFRVSCFGFRIPGSGFRV